MASLVNNSEQPYQITDLPPEIIYIILNESGLSELDKASAGEVLPGWGRLIRPLSNSHLTVYGKKVWEENLGYLIKEKIPLLPSRVEVLTTLSLLEGKLERPGCMLALMPKGLTLNKLLELMQNPRKGSKTEVAWFWSLVLKELGDKAIDKTCWVLFSESVIVGSRSKFYAEKKAFVIKETNSLCVMPELIVAIACVALKRVKTGQGILENSYTSCEESISSFPNEMSAVVGGFSAGSINLGFRELDAQNIEGVAAYQKFEPYIELENAGYWGYNSIQNIVEFVRKLIYPNNS